MDSSSSDSDDSMKSSSNCELSEEDANSSDCTKYHLNYRLDEDKFIKRQKKTEIIAFHDSIYFGYMKLFKFYLDKKINITDETSVCWEEDEVIDYIGLSWNSLDQAIIVSTAWPENENCMYFYQVLREKSLKMFSSYGLHPLHIECAVGDISEVKKLIEQCDINKKIDDQSPLWPGMTPLPRCSWNKI